MTNQQEDNDMNTTAKTPIEQMNEDLRSALGVEFRPITDSDRERAREVFRGMGVDVDNEGPSKELWDEVLSRNGMDPSKITAYNVKDDEERPHAVEQGVAPVRDAVDPQTGIP